MNVYRIMHLGTRTLNGMRRKPWLHLLSFLTLSAAFLSFSASLTAALNLESLLNKWIGNAEMSAYLREGASQKDIQKLAQAISAIEGVRRVETLSEQQARLRFARDIGSWNEFANSLPLQAFPASLDIYLDGTLAKNAELRRRLASRIEKVELVESIDIYDDWFSRLSGLTLLGRLVAWGLGLLALAVALLVIAAVVRSSVSSRQREIDVLGLVGASRYYILLPFLLEGAFEALAAMGASLGALAILIHRFQKIAGDAIPLFGMPELARLNPSAVALLLVGASLVGLLSARLSLRGLINA